MRAAGVWMAAMSALAAIDGAQTGRTAMNPEDTRKINLSRQIAVPNREGAATLAGSLPAGDVGDVLKDMAGNEKAPVRMLVLELASKHPSEGASRATLSRLQDTNLTVRSIAGGLIAMIAQKSVVPEMLELAEQDLDPRVRGALARQVGMIGDAGDLPRLRTQYRAAQDPGLKNDLAAAMARLGDEAYRKDLIRRLTDPEAAVRLAAFRDTLYVGDRRLALYFRPAVEDRRNAMVVSFPHDPVVWARVCDVAIQTLAGLGLQLSYGTVPTRRFTEAEIQEALQILNALAKTQAQ